MFLSFIQITIPSYQKVPPTYWPTDPNQLPDLMDFFITSKISPSNADIQPSYDLSSDHTPIIATISTTVIKRKSKPRLHNAYTNWQHYKTEICNRMNCDWKLKTCEDLDIATARFTHILQQAAELATPKSKSHAPINNIPSTIKRLVALKRKAKATWQKTHAPEDRRIYNNASRNLQSTLHFIISSLIYPAFISAYHTGFSMCAHGHISQLRPRFFHLAQDKHGQKD